MSSSTPSLPRVAPPAAALPGLTVGAFGAAIFVGAALVFLVQPMLAKMVLPLFGGSPAVWLVSLVFFQAVLLVGYSFAHLSMRFLSVRRQALVQLGVLLTPFPFLPTVVNSDAAVGDVAPALAVVALLAVAAGIPYFVVTTASPVLQRWFAATGDRSADDPYFLYAASNAGSLLGLLAYPIVIEPQLDLGDQARLWAAGYTLFVVLAVACAARLLLRAPVAVVSARVSTSAASIPWARRFRWLGMAALPSSLMLGTSNYLATDIASVPLLWVIPLAVYLLSFVAAFARKPPVSLRMTSAAVVLSSLLVAATMLRLVPLPTWALVSIHAANLFLIALLVHRRLADERPPVERLTEFYLLLSAGGVVGGALTAIVAPYVFPVILEYPIALVLALLVRPGARGRPAGGPLKRHGDVLAPVALFGALVFGLVAVSSLGSVAVRIVLGLAVVSLLLLRSRPVRFAAALAVVLAVAALGQLGGMHVERTFFGVLKVVEPKPGEHVLVHGTRIHGAERFLNGMKNEPLTYFTRSGPIGQVFAGPARDASSVGVIGLGAGSLASYGRTGSTMTFYEIDRAVADVAENPRYFTFLRDARAEVDVVIGDGRLELARERDGAFDLLVLDAFSSDAIPVHLLTREAVELYLRKLRPGGLLAFHITNSHLELAPVVAGVSRSLGLSALVQTHRVTAAEREAGGESSTWVALARAQEALGELARDRRWRPLLASGDDPVWTDQYSNILSVLRWTG
jgi:hypothetical protein